LNLPPTNPIPTSRRHFIAKSAGAAAIGVAWHSLPQQPLAASPSPSAPQWPIAVFEKVFEALSYDDLADAIEQITADGVEATIRPGGHIEPEAAPDELPKMVDAMRRRGRRVLIAATHIRRADEPHTESLLETFRGLGISHYRMGHYRLDSTTPPWRQVAEYTAQARDLATLNKTLGLQGLYQNHAGAGYLGALAWDLATMLKGINPNDLGVACDLRHLRAETGQSWKTAVQVLKSHIRSIYLKDAIWTGPRGDQLKDVPLDTGFVNESMFETVREGLPPIPLCIHMEHMGYRVFEKHEIPGAIRAHQADIAALRRWLA